jgi:long-subunit acyl-CoA synthetase (AMP-forming)
MYTSGSTGKPKGVIVTEPMFTYDISHAIFLYPYVSVSFIPLSHSTDRMRIWETLMNGIKKIILFLVIYSYKKLRSRLYFLEKITFNFL